jgi:NADPH-dependent curcumin reductase CurA
VSVPSHADVIVLNRRPGPSLLPGDLVPERRPLRAPSPGEVVVRNVVTSVDPYQLRMLRGSSEVTPVAIGDPVHPTRLSPIRAELAALLRAKQLRVVVSEFEGLERANQALTTVFDRGSPYIGSRVVRISDG